jgi:hypothetical protein
VRIAANYLSSSEVPGGCPLDGKLTSRSTIVRFRPARSYVIEPGELVTFTDEPPDKGELTLTGVAWTFATT